MAVPNAGQIHVATDALRTEAGTWDAQAAAMATVQSKLAAVTLTRLQAGIFQVVFDAYSEVLHQVAARTGEATPNMHQVGETLRQVAGTYDREEATHVHVLKHLY